MLGARVIDAPRVETEDALIVGVKWNREGKRQSDILTAVHEELEFPAGFVSGVRFSHSGGVRNLSLELAPIEDSTAIVHADDHAGSGSDRERVAAKIRITKGFKRNARDAAKDDAL